jgi:PBP1b-binding outer membrane lipoprotein LpoB
MKLISKGLFLALLLSACSTPHIPDPDLQVQPFPDTLIQHSRKPVPIPAQEPTPIANQI